MRIPPPQTPLTPRLLLSATLALLCLPSLMLAQATTGFNQTTAGPWDYNTPANWVGGTTGDINGVWDSSLTLTATQTVTFATDTTLSGGLNFGYAGSLNVTLSADGTANHTVTLDGNIAVNTASANRTITIGSSTANQNLDMDLDGGTRTFDVQATAGSNNQRSLTIVNNISNGSLVMQGGGNINLSASSSTSTMSLDSLTIKNAHLNANAFSDIAISGALVIDGAGGLNASGNTGGTSIISMAATGSRDHTLTADSLTRQNGGVVFFRGTNLGTSAPGTNNTASITFANTPTLVGGGGSAGSTNISILPWAVGATTTSSAPTTFVTYDATNGIRALDTSSEFTTYADAYNGTVTGTNDNIRIAGTSTVTFTGDNTVNSLLLGDTGSSLNGTGTLTVTSGAIYITSNAASSLNINTGFGSRQGVIGYTQGKGSNITGAISGSGGLVLYQNQPYDSPSSGGTGVTISGSAANSTYSGDTYVIGRASVNVDGFLPNGSRTGDVYVYGLLDIGTSVTINGLNGTGNFSKAFSGSATFNIGDNNANGNFTGVIANNGSTTIAKIGTGTQVFGGANTYTGGTQVNAGTLLITNTTGSGTGTGAITIASGARFGGSGTATGAVTASASDSVIIAGSLGSIGTLSLSGGLAASSGATFDFDLNGASADTIDFGAGTLSLGGTLTFDFTNLGTVQSGAPYTLFTGTGSWSSVASTFVFNSPSGYVLDTGYGSGAGYVFDTTGDTLTVQFLSTTPVPEPASCALLAGLCGLALVTLRRRRA